MENYPFPFALIINPVRRTVVGLIFGSVVKIFLDALTVSQPFVAETRSPGRERVPRVVLPCFASSINNLSLSVDLKTSMTSRQVAWLCIASCPIEG